MGQQWPGFLASELCRYAEGDGADETGKALREAPKEMEEREVQQHHWAELGVKTCSSRPGEEREHGELATGNYSGVRNGCYNLQGQWSRGHSEWGCRASTTV